MRRHFVVVAGTTFFLAQGHDVSRRTRLEPPFTSAIRERRVVCTSHWGTLIVRTKGDRFSDPPDVRV
jgi:hypothetical protein